MLTTIRRTSWSNSDAYQAATLATIPPSGVAPCMSKVRKGISRPMPRPSANDATVPTNATRGKTQG